MPVIWTALWAHLASQCLGATIWMEMCTLVSLAPWLSFESSLTQKFLKLHGIWWVNIENHCRMVCPAFRFTKQIFFICDAWIHPNVHSWSLCISQHAHLCSLLYMTGFHEKLSKTDLASQPLTCSIIEPLMPSPYLMTFAPILWAFCIKTWSLCPLQTFSWELWIPIRPFIWSKWNILVSPLLRDVFFY